MSELADIRRAIATTLAAVPNLRIYDQVPDAPQPPCAIVIPETIRYGQLFSGEANYRIVLQVMTSAVNTSAGQEQLDALISPTGPNSIARVLDDRPTLDGTVALCQLTDLRNYGVVGDAVRYYSAELVLDLWAT
jgi:hypothetical protein